MDTALELRTRRIRAGLSQTNLAQLVGTTQDTVSRWERGIMRPAAPGALSLALDHLTHCLHATSITPTAATAARQASDPKPPPPGNKRRSGPSPENANPQTPHKKNAPLTRRHTPTDTPTTPPRPSKHQQRPQQSGNHQHEPRQDTCTNTNYNPRTPEPANRRPPNHSEPR